MSIIHGSSGIIYFVHEFKPKFNEHALLDDAVTLEAVTVINKQIHELASVLNCPTVPNAVSVETPDSKAPVAVMMKQDGIAIYLFAVGMRNQPTEATFSIKDFPISTNIEVVGENRTRKVEQGTFSDTFQPYDVHIYKIRL